MTEPDIELPHDVLLSNEFAQNALTSHDHNVRDTAPIPFDGGQPVIAPMRMGLVHNLEELHGLLQLGTFRVLPLESTGPLEKGAGHACLVEAVRARTLHPTDDAGWAQPMRCVAGLAGGRSAEPCTRCRAGRL